MNYTSHTAVYTAFVNALIVNPILGGGGVQNCTPLWFVAPKIRRN